MKKAAQLGMNPGTASGRLVRDLLFSFVTKAGVKCYRCGNDMARDDFSIDHKVPWLDSEDPVKMFFDLDNVAFSHKSCNSRDARHPTALNLTDEDHKKRNAAIERERWHGLPREQRRAIRRRNYERNGK